ncbi:5-(carboxyamino)imidazole ribonucleotide synthase [Pararhizobium mangrovi]|uniref:N5-carboxyaminoimidazole ribonucleotide synthase n=1 Tax=Pararhizobium mangrovi TaxID=2590452 RepID=A0A506U0F2_9HYPH|nr:5-(carboxyamino)imidazole ribonucleotide synthase [Pararhizobium mangrovi]TPW26671.1 5-(carboxyamino)imidazole ribonucleotide synthase [Pararhizobium mangrovi]
MSVPLPRRSAIGIVGGGQLGRMLAMAAARLDYRVVVLDPAADSPAGEVAYRQIVAAYDDPAALDELADATEVVTYEFENVPVAAAERLAARKPVFPPPAALEAAQDRLTEKRFLARCGIATARFEAVDDQTGLEAALSAFAGRGILKTRRMGYDGKGQRRFAGPDDSPHGVFEAMGGVPLILEETVTFAREISVIAARGRDGETVAYEPAENVHENGILRRSVVPAAIDAETRKNAITAAESILEALDYVGVIGVEFFVLDDGTVIANEIAPRVHNSGHWTEAACVVSQFEMHMRAVAGLPLAAPMRHSDCTMENLLGDEVERLPALAREPNAFVHLYGKETARAGRKMGHVTWLGGAGKRN